MKKYRAVNLLLRTFDISPASANLNNTIDNDFGRIVLGGTSITFRNVPIRRILGDLCRTHDFFTITLSMFSQATETPAYNIGSSYVLLSGLNFVSNKNDSIPTRNLPYKTPATFNRQGMCVGFYQQYFGTNDETDQPFGDGVRNIVVNHNPVVFTKPSSEFLDIGVDLIIDHYLLTTLSNFNSYTNFSSGHLTFVFEIHPVITDYKLYKQLRNYNMMSADLVLRTWEISPTLSDTNQNILNSQVRYINNSLGEIIVGQKITWKNINLERVLGSLYNVSNYFNLCLVSVGVCGIVTTYTSFGYNVDLTRNVVISMSGLNWLNKDFIRQKTTQDKMIGLVQMTYSIIGSQHINHKDSHNTFVKQQMTDLTIELFSNQTNSFTNVNNSDTTNFPNANYEVQPLQEKIIGFQPSQHQTYIFKIYPVFI